MCKEDTQLPALTSASDLNIKLPKPHEKIKEEGEKANGLIKQHGYADKSTGQTFIEKTALPYLLATDQKGANKIWNETDDEDKRLDGKKRLMSVPAVQKVIATRIEEPRDTLEKERLKHSEQALIALRDAPEIEKERQLQEVRNRKDFPKIKNKIIKDNNIITDECTGKPLEPNPHGHHIERRADNPRKVLDPNNIAIVNCDTHREKIHHKNSNLEDKDSLLEYSRNNGGSLHERIDKNKE